MESKLETVITVPHKACPPERRGHLCDFDAPAAARALRDALPGSMLIESEVHRDPTQIASDGGPGSDMNRPWARQDTAFQKRLNDALAAKPRLVLDIHSFPGDALGESDVVVLDPHRGFGWDPASFSLVVHLMADDVRVALKRGGSENYIVVRSRATGAKAVLIEFAERAEGAPRERIARAIASIAEWAKEETSSVQPL